MNARPDDPETGGPHSGTPEGQPEPPEQRRTAADERTDPAAPPEQEQPG